MGFGIKTKIKAALRPGRYVEILKVPENNDLLGKNVLITGGTSGIGLAAAKRFLECGASVVVTGRPSKGRLQATVEQLGPKAYGVEWDASAPFDGENLLSRAEAALGGKIDALFANAGIYFDGNEAWAQENVSLLFNTNLHSVCDLITAYVHRCEGEDRSGAIVVTGSNAGLMPYIYPYGLTKVALHSFVQGVARVHSHNRIRINAIAPGVTATDINPRDPSGDLGRNFKTIGNSRVIRPEEIAEVALFLLSDRSLCINGAIIPCDLGDSLR